MLSVRKKKKSKQLEKLERFFTEIPQYSANWNPDLFKSQADIDKIGDWRQMASVLIDGHPDKSRLEYTVTN